MPFIIIFFLISDLYILDTEIAEVHADIARKNVLSTIAIYLKWYVLHII